MLTAVEAEAVLREWLGGPARCLALRRFHGGMINSVLEAEFDRAPHRAVIKVSGRSTRTLSTSWPTWRCSGR